MKALVLNALQQPLDYQEVPEPHPQAGEVLVRINAAALNHRDVYITKGLYAGIKYPCILGSDGAGEYNDQAVILYPALAWGEDPRAQGKQFRVLGMPDNGTFAEYIAIPKVNLHPKPEHLNWKHAAALPLAGLTAYRTLFTRCQLQKGEKVLISGIGGGVAFTAMQFAVAAGAEVFVTSGTQEKVERAVHFGAKDGAVYKEADWDKKLKTMAGGFDVVIDSAGGDGFAALAALCNPGGRIGIYGGSLGKMNGLSPQIIFWKQISILGSTMGTFQDFRDMLAFVQKHQIVPEIDSVYPMRDGNEAMAKMEAGAQFGKIVLGI